MKYNLDAVSETLFGKFLSCLVMADPGAITDHDLSSLDLVITLDNKEINLSAAFSAFERTVNNGLNFTTTRVVEQRPARRGTPVWDDIDSLIDAVQEAHDEACNVNGYVESATNDLVDAASDAAAEAASDHARESTREACWEHALGGEVNYEVIRSLDSVLDALREARSNT